jgi:hypothetical protein
MNFVGNAGGTGVLEKMLLHRVARIYRLRMQARRQP